MHLQSLEEAARILDADGLGASLIAQDFFSLPSPDEPGAPLQMFDAVVGNPPFIRYQEHTGPIPPALGHMAGLQYLSLNDNQLSGPIPAELAMLVGLQSLRLSGNVGLTGCVPASLRAVATNDLADVALPDCQP